MQLDKDLMKIIDTLESNDSKAAPIITNALKSLGGGSMQKGLAVLQEYAVNNAKPQQLLEGAGIGAGATLGAVALTILIKSLIKSSKIKKEDKQKILESLEQATKEIEAQQDAQNLSDSKQPDSANFTHANCNPESAVE